MEHFGRWLTRNSERRLGTKRQMLAIFSTLGLILFPIIAAAAYSDGHSVAAAILGALGGICGLGWAPYMAFRRQTKHRDRYRIEFQRLGMLQFTGRIAEELGRKSEVLESAARDWDSIDALAERATVETELVARVRAEADLRMDRVFELTAAPPAYNGLTESQATAQVGGDRQWLSRARDALEAATLTGTVPAAPSEDVLARLRAVASEREAAVAELKG